MLKKFALTLLVIATSNLTSVAQDAEKFVELFNGKDLTGWNQAGGTAKYRVEAGVIIGESVPKTPNSFLCTERIYGDFELEYEYKCDNLLNSGVQIRSNVYSVKTICPLGNGKSRSIPAGRVHGYQVEIDPNKPERMWSGGIYDEGRRGWLFPGIAGGDDDATKAKFTKAGQDAYKPNEWNKVRVRCQGEHVQTWLNGVARADFKDGMTKHGVIALQVHGVGKHVEAIGKTVQWKNLRIKELK